MTNERDPIVHVVPYYPPHIGGMENVARTVSEGLAAAGRTVEVLTSTSGPSRAPRVERSGNLTVRRLPTVEFAHLPFMPTLLFHLLRLPRRAVVHVHIAQAYAPEMVWLSSVLRRRAYVAHFHLDVEPSGPLGPIFVAYKRWLLGPILRSAARVIVLSEGSAAFVACRYGVAADRIAIVPNGVAPEFLRSPSERASHDGPFRLLFVGRLAPQKNVARLLRAVAVTTSPVELAIVGDGEDRAMIEELIRDLHLGNVRMVGSRTGADLVAWYRWADAFASPSDKEGGLPLVILEAMASGLPVISTDVPGVTETMGADGLLTAVDPAAMARTIDHLVAHPALAAELGRRAYERASHHPWPVVLSNLEDVYRSVAA
jgi:glycosyltransferase involved in cell wall biosynthesis